MFQGTNRHRKKGPKPKWVSAVWYTTTADATDMLRAFVKASATCRVEFGHVTTLAPSRSGVLERLPSYNSVCKQGTKLTQTKALGRFGRPDCASPQHRCKVAKIQLFALFLRPLHWSVPGDMQMPCKLMPQDLHSLMLLQLQLTS